MTLQLDLFKTPDLLTVSLEKDFSRKLKRKTKIIFTKNRSSLISVQKRGENEIYLRVQEIFIHAPHPVWEAICTFIVFPSNQPRRIIREFISRNGVIRHLEKAHKPFKLETKGIYYHLDTLYEIINQQYFNGEVQCDITWGRTYTKRRRRHISFGSYDPFTNLIKINPSLDQKIVPEFFVRYIIYHEMIHAKLENSCPPPEGKKVYHSAEFYEWERKFIDYEESIHWEKKNIGIFIK